jgi:hypothetical protein
MDYTRTPWRVLTAHGAVLAYVTMHPGCNSAELADALVISRRTAWRLLADIERSGAVRRRKRRKTYHYFLNAQAHLPDPVFRGLTLREVVEEVIFRIHALDSEADQHASPLLSNRPIGF